ncbi:MAG: response regulator transcription factor [Lewinellaceae bacterium]|nr:response regulator transcription factor [Saprospiraceae bacterium]MCB9330535.1 response regulator transcription factor [Lewinellaceae bacterium]
MHNDQRILLVEDDLNLGLLLMDYLESEGLQVTWRRDALSGLQQVKRQPFDLCILDVMMAGMDGFSLAKNLRSQYPKLPFLFLTARMLKEDRLKGYALGAEDYLTKPFDEEELLCKIRVILRRTAETAAPAEKTIQIGRFTFNPARQELRIDARTIRLTEKENAVLRLLSQHQNRILRRDEAVEKIYGKYDYFLGRSFDVFISRLRKLLKADPNVSIENVFKVGFILNVKEGQA